MGVPGSHQDLMIKRIGTSVAIGRKEGKSGEAPPPILAPLGSQHSFLPRKRQRPGRRIWIL